MKSVGESFFALDYSVIRHHKPSLAACAFGAGLVHVLIVAAVLPVLITLPAPDGLTQRTVSVPVAVRTALPVPVASAAGSGEFAEVLLFGEGDVDEVALPAAVPLKGSGPDLPVQRALTEPVPLIQQAGLSGAVRAPARPETIAPVPAHGARSAEEVERSIIARLPDFMPDTLPRPKLKPDAASLTAAPAAASGTKPRPAARRKSKPQPQSRPVAKARPQSASGSGRPVAGTRPQPAPPAFGNFFSGGVGRSMKEFPLPASR